MLVMLNPLNKEEALFRLIAVWSWGIWVRSNTMHTITRKVENVSNSVEQLPEPRKWTRVFILRICKDILIIWQTRTAVRRR